MKLRKVYFYCKGYSISKITSSYFLIMIMSCLLTACTSKVDKVSVPFDLPPNAPIPPETFCFELKDAGMIQLTKTGDSIVGEVEFNKSAKLTGGTFTGAIYGTNFFLSYKFDNGKGLQMQDRQWKLEDGILYANFTRHFADTLNPTGDTKNDQTIAFEFKKIPCK